jgi:hypothetical protein
MARQIKTPITLRITEAEIVDSQLEAEDTSAATKSFGGDGAGGTECQSKYCEKGYSAPEMPVELA